MKISWFEILLIFAFRTSRQGSSRLRSIISVIDHPDAATMSCNVVLHKNYVLGVLWSLNSIQTQYKRFWSILVDTDIIFSHKNPDFGSQIRKFFPGPSLNRLLLNAIWISFWAQMQGTRPFWCPDWGPRMADFGQIVSVCVSPFWHIFCRRDLKGRSACGHG